MFPYWPYFGGNIFPGTDLHTLDLDWILRVIKDFKDKYENIQQIIDTGKDSLDAKTQEDLAALQAGYVETANSLEALYNQTLANYQTNARAIAAAVNNSIPQDYTALSRSVFAQIMISNEQLVTYNYYTKVITIPEGCFCVYNGVPRAIINELEVDVSDNLQSEACNLWLLGDYTIAAAAFGTQPDDTSARYLGSIYRKDVWLNGVPTEFIKIIGQDGIMTSVYPNNKGSFIAFNQDIRIVTVDNVNKTITLPVGFRVYRGKTYAVNDETIHFESSVASKIWMKNTGVVYCTEWNDNVIWHPDDDCIGYLYNNTVIIAGVDKDAINIIDGTDSSKVYVFGDSIPAGTQTTKTFTMFLHDYDKTMHYLNYAQGSTGYIAEWTGNATKGGGTEGVGTTQALTGDNTVLDQMQEILDPMANILIMAGTNDWSIGAALADFQAAVEAALDYALTQTQNVFVMLPIKRENWATATNAINKKLEDYSDIIKEVCIAKGVVYFDGFDVFLNPSLAGNKSIFVPDGLHPNSKGHERIARAIYNTVRQAYIR